MKQEKSTVSEQDMGIAIFLDCMTFYNVKSFIN